MLSSLVCRDPKKGLKFLTEKKFLEPDSPADVAYMLACYKRGLNKAQVGEYLASEKPFNSKVLKLVLVFTTYLTTDLRESVLRGLSNPRFQLAEICSDCELFLSERKTTVFAVDWTVVLFQSGKEHSFKPII